MLRKRKGSGAGEIGLMLAYLPPHDRDRVFGGYDTVIVEGTQTDNATQRNRSQRG